LGFVFADRLEVSGIGDYRRHGLQPLKSVHWQTTFGRRALFTTPTANRCSGCLSPYNREPISDPIATAVPKMGASTGAPRDRHWIGFDDPGQVTGRTEAGAHRERKGLEYPSGTWHSLVCLRPDTVIFECKQGPFAPVQSEDFAPRAPHEGAHDASDYVRWMVRATPGGHFDQPEGR
jgi:hypothetical protein